MKTKEKKAYELHAEHTQWINSLKFYKDEILVFQHRITEIATKYTDREILKMIESFQNRLKIQSNEIDNLIHTIKDHELYVEHKVENNPAADHKTLHDHQKER